MKISGKAYAFSLFLCYSSASLFFLRIRPIMWVYVLMGMMVHPFGEDVDMVVFMDDDVGMGASVMGMRHVMLVEMGMVSLQDVDDDQGDAKDHHPQGEAEAPGRDIPE